MYKEKDLLKLAVNYTFFPLSIFSFSFTDWNSGDFYIIFIKKRTNYIIVLQHNTSYIISSIFVVHRSTLSTYYFNKSCNFEQSITNVHIIIHISGYKHLESNFNLSFFVSVKEKRISYYVWYFVPVGSTRVGL